MALDWYQMAKDFAGPASTVFAAIVAAGVTGTFAYQQWRTAKLQANIALNKLKYDTFAARHDVPVAVYDLVRHTLSKKSSTASIEYAIECRARIDKAKFYFPQEILRELNLISIKSARLEVYYERENSASFLEREKIRERIDALENELASRAVELPDLLRPYLSIDLLSQADISADYYQFYSVLHAAILVAEVILIFGLLAIAGAVGKGA